MAKTISKHSGANIILGVAEPVGELKVKSNSVMTADTVGTSIVWKFVDGKSLEFDAAKAMDVAQDARMHGFKQKIADAAAMSRNPETGMPATVAEKRAAMESVIASLYAGQWNQPKGDGSGGYLVRALMELKPQAAKEAIVAFVDGLTKRQQDALRASDEIRPLIEAMKPAASAVDTKELLKGL